MCFLVGHCRETCLFWKRLVAVTAPSSDQTGPEEGDCMSPHEEQMLAVTKTFVDECCIEVSLEAVIYQVSRHRRKLYDLVCVVDFIGSGNMFVDVMISCVQYYVNLSIGWVEHVLSSADGHLEGHHGGVPRSGPPSPDKVRSLLAMGDT